MKRFTILTFSTLALVLQVHRFSSAAGQFRGSLFKKVQLCSLPSSSNMEDVVSTTKLECAAQCHGQDDCTGCSFFVNNTCSLHYDDMDSYVCNNATATSTVHYQKMEDNSTSHCQNGGTPINSTACQCQNGYIGDLCERLMMDCADGLSSGHYPTMDGGMYLALPSNASAPIQVHCDTNVQVVALHRWKRDFDFNRTMNDYVDGFGSATDYWAGLHKLHLLTSNPYSYYLGVQVANYSNDPFYQCYYMDFKVLGPETGYAMSFTSYVPAGAPAQPMGDCFTPLMGARFSSYDDDNDGNASRNCAAEYGGGWWYSDDCSQCNLVGTLRLEQTRVPGAVDEVFWIPGLDPPDFSPANVIVFLYR